MGNKGCYVIKTHHLYKKKKNDVKETYFCTRFKIQIHKVYSEYIRPPAQNTKIKKKKKTDFLGRWPYVF